MGALIVLIVTSAIIGIGVLAGLAAWVNACFRGDDNAIAAAWVLGLVVLAVAFLWALSEVSR